MDGGQHGQKQCYRCRFELCWTFSCERNSDAESWSSLISKAPTPREADADDSDAESWSTSKLNASQLEFHHSKRPIEGLLSESLLKLRREVPCGNIRDKSAIVSGHEKDGYPPIHAHDSKFIKEKCALQPFDSKALTNLNI